MNKHTNIGVQLMPIILVVAAVSFYAMEGKVYSLACMILAVMFWAVIWHENEKQKN